MISLKNIIKNIIPYGIVVSISERKKLNKFKQNFLKNRKFLEDGRFVCTWEDKRPCLDDVTQNTSFDHHYVYHTAWASRILVANDIKKHVDISSSIYFVTQISAFIKTEFYDYRPALINLSGLTSSHCDLLHLDFMDNSIDSLSCMHVIEHIGLERYGDSFDPRGDIKAINELKRVLSPEGRLLFVVPIGEIPCIQYNAHRIYSFKQIMGYFDGFCLDNFSYVNDNGKFIVNATEIDTIGQKYGCGCFCFKK